MTTTEFNELLKKAQAGDAEAQYNLGLCYDKGEGVNKDINLARHWWQKAAKQGSTDAQKALRIIKE